MNVTCDLLGHILCMPTDRHAKIALCWIPPGREDKAGLRILKILKSLMLHGTMLRMIETAVTHLLPNML